VGHLRAIAARVVHYFDTGAWSEREPRERHRWARLDRVGRIVGSTLRGAREQKFTFRAAALTYFSTLSIVPLLAVAFSVLKGFGAYRDFVELTVEPYLEKTFGGNPSLYRSLHKILAFVERTDVARLGYAGMLFLLGSSIGLLSNVETALNDIWGAKTPRPILRRVTDYTTLLVIAPLLMLVAFTFATAAQSSSVVSFLRDTLALGPVIDLLLRLTSLVVACLAMTALYLILPNARVRVLSAIIGGVVAGLVWQVSLVLHVRFQVGVANYNALYSGFGAIPIFLVWMSVSWMAVLIGALVAASHQNEQVLHQRLRSRYADQQLKETLGVAVAARVTRDFLDGGPRRTVAELSELLAVPPPVMDDVVEQLARAGVMAKTVCGGDIAFLPGRDVDQVRAEDVRLALREDPRAGELRRSTEEHLDHALARMLATHEERQRTSDDNLTLRGLAALVPSVGGRERQTPEVLDAKQPDVPS
jgi:membrane protein